MSEMYIPLGAVIVAALALTAVMHVGERTVDAQPRSRMLPALGCYLVVMAGVLGAFLGVLLWSLSRWPQ